MAWASSGVGAVKAGEPASHPELSEGAGPGVRGRKQRNEGATREPPQEAGARARQSATYRELLGGWRARGSGSPRRSRQVGPMIQPAREGFEEPISCEHERTLSILRVWIYGPTQGLAVVRAPEDGHDGVHTARVHRKENIAAACTDRDSYSLSTRRTLLSQ